MTNICTIGLSADTHMGFRQYGYPQREGDFYEAARRVFETAIRNKANALILAGDVFDSPKPPALAVWVLQQLVKLANNAGVMVFGIDGNHDPCDGHWLKVCGVEVLSEEPMLIRGIPVVGIHATRSSDLFRRLDQMIAKGVKADILVIHQAVSELADFGTDITALALAPKAKALGVRYVAMGDIHNYKETVIGDVRFCYPGSPEIKALDESRDKSMSMVTFRPDGTMGTSMLPLETRPFKDYRLNDESDLTRLTLDANQPGTKPLLIVSYEAAKRDLAARAETVMQTAGLMYRLYPITTGDNMTLRDQLGRQGFERKGALTQLKNAVNAFFEEGTDEFQLVFQLLEAPDTVKEIVNRYAVSKGLTL